MHPLKIYLKQNKIKKKHFAKLINISDRMLYYYLNFKKFPSRKTAIKIIELTNKEITMNDLYCPDLIKDNINHKNDGIKNV